jgi:hypothetical protein
VSNEEGVLNDRLWMQVKALTDEKLRWYSRLETLMAEREESRRRHRQDDEEKGLLADEVMIPLLKTICFMHWMCCDAATRSCAGRDH